MLPKCSHQNCQAPHQECAGENKKAEKAGRRKQSHRKKEGRATAFGVLRGNALAGHAVVTRAAPPGVATETTTTQTAADGQRRRKRTQRPFLFDTPAPLEALFSGGVQMGGKRLLFLAFNPHATPAPFQRAVLPRPASAFPAPILPTVIAPHCGPRPYFYSREAECHFSPEDLLCAISAAAPARMRTQSADAVAACKAPTVTN